VTFAPDPSYAGFARAIAPHFTLLRELGRGGMGVVFLARDIRLDREVAIKVLPAHLAADDALSERFLREARTAAKLSHPNIVPVFRADEAAGFAYFAMGYVEGESVAQRVRGRGPLPLDESVRLLRETAWALAYAHARGVIHRDVKAENILVERGSGRAMVTDFGIARVESNPGLTAEGHVVGTAHYMPPEQIAGGAIDGRVDLYALGVVGFLMLAGRLPFDGDASPAVLVQHMTAPAPRLQDIAPDVPTPLAEIIDRCLAKRPGDRWPNGEALADALQKGLDAALALVEANTPSTGHLLSETQARLVWQRAAQLQAEAARRLEQQSRESAQQRAVSELPTSGYRARDVEAAAVEAGISQRYVALAMAELPKQDVVVSAASGGTVDRLATQVLGTSQRAVSASRVIRFAPRRVLGALGRELASARYQWELVDQLGGHPLSGGILVYKLPEMTGDGNTFGVTWTRYGVFAPDVRVTIRPLDSTSAEVTLYIDLRPGLGINLWTYLGINGVLSGFGGVLAGTVAAKAMAVAAVATLGVGGGVAVSIAALGLLASRALYPWEVRKARAELGAVLASIESALKREDLFGQVPELAPPPRRDGGDDVASLLFG